jgi:membrane protease YdiL (CAAX protease family)
VASSNAGVAGWAVDLPVYAVIVVGISVVATLLYNGTGGSVLITMVFHADRRTGPLRRVGGSPGRTSPSR